MNREGLAQSQASGWEKLAAAAAKHMRIESARNGEQRRMLRIFEDTVAGEIPTGGCVEQSEQMEGGSTKNMSQN